MTYPARSVSDDEPGGIIYEITEDGPSLEEIVENCKEAFPLHSLADIRFVLAEDGKLVVAINDEIPTRVS